MSVWERLRYVSRIKYRPRSTLALLRMLWSDLVLHVLLNRGSETCEDCGSFTYALWSAPDELWRAVSTGGSSSGLLCYECFSRRCDERGFVIKAHVHLLRDLP
jgi:hypothetical protein